MTGKGRLPEPVDIARQVEAFFAKARDLLGRKVLVTAGGTREPLDPVRYLGNRSTGRMGYAIAQEAAARGADVVLVSAPSALPVPPGVRCVHVETAREMREAVLREFDDADAVIKAAAVDDYRPKIVAENKIKKSEGEFTLVLERNPDILLELGQKKRRQCSSACGRDHEARGVRAASSRRRTSTSSWPTMSRAPMRALPSIPTVPSSSCATARSVTARFHPRRSSRASYWTTSGHACHGFWPFFLWECLFRARTA